MKIGPFNWLGFQTKNFKAFFEHDYFDKDGSLQMNLTFSKKVVIINNVIERYQDWTLLLVQILG